MKKLLFACCLLATVNSFAQPKAAKSKTETIKVDTEIDWQKFVNRDFVADGITTMNVDQVIKGQVIQVRFYERGLRPMHLGSQQPYKISSYMVEDNSDVLSVKALTDGCVSVILATGNRHVGPFSETITIVNPTSTGYILRIKGLIVDDAEAVK